MRRARRDSDRPARRGDLDRPALRTRLARRLALEAWARRTRRPGRRQGAPPERARTLYFGDRGQYRCGHGVDRAVRARRRDPLTAEPHIVQMKSDVLSELGHALITGSLTDPEL